MERSKPLTGRLDINRKSDVGILGSRCSVSTSLVSEVCRNKRTRLPDHSHELASFNLLVEGNYAEFYGTRRLVCDPLTVLWCPPGVTHSNEFGNSGGRIFYIELAKGSLDLLQAYSTIPESFATRKPALVSLALRIRREFEGWEAHSPLLVEGLIWEMLAVSIHQNERRDRRPPDWLKRVMTMLHDNFRQGVSMNRLAAEAGVHPVHLSQVFREFKNRSVGEYIQDLRVNLSARLLLEDKMTISEVAIAAGFSDQSHLTRVFKRRMNTTPGAFRKDRSLG
ncbi:MAG: helix-turn-helix transcriptional regulator [Aridibacter famidurans]|nr:helix-turn-helix transcriptional regulator [Aridibacter famidurans]